MDGLANSLLQTLASIMVGQIVLCGSGSEFNLPRDKQSPPPDTKVPPGSRFETNEWVLKSMSDLRENMLAGQQKTEKTLERIDDRLRRIEHKVSVLFLSFMIVSAILATLWGGYNVFTEFFDVTITPKP